MAGHIITREGKTGKLYYARYKTPDGKWKWEAAGKYKKDAEVLLRRRQQEVVAGLYGREDIPFEELYNRYMTSKRKSLKPSTIKSIESSHLQYIEPYFSESMVSTITPLLVQSWVDDLSNRVAPATARKAYRYLRSILKQAEAWGLIEDVPCRPKAIILPSDTNDEMVFLGPSEVHRLLDSSQGFYKVLYSLLVYSGLRIGEAQALTWRRINYGENTIIVERAWSSMNGFTKPKTPGSRRAVPMIEVLSEVLKEYQYRQTCESDNLLFPAKRNLNKPKHHSIINRNFKAALKRAELKEVTVHSLRHTFVSVMLASGASVKALQRALGHSTATMTLDTYGHLIPEGLGDSLSRANDIFICQ